MRIDVKEELKTFALENKLSTDFRFSDIEVERESIQTIMINEVVPQDPADDFYGNHTPPNYLTTTVPLFKKAGFDCESIEDILDAGIYITNAVKVPKEETTIPREMIQESLPLLEYEMRLFPNVKVIMLMGDVAKKAFNRITKAKTKKNAVPSVSTYKLRNSELYFENIRVFPSYIMTGRNILIEKSKVEMAADDIRKMLKIIQ